MEHVGREIQKTGLLLQFLQKKFHRFGNSSTGVCLLTSQFYNARLAVVFVTCSVQYRVCWTLSQTLLELWLAGSNPTKLLMLLDSSIRLIAGGECLAKLTYDNKTIHHLFSMAYQIGLIRDTTAPGIPPCQLRGCQKNINGKWHQYISQ